MDPPVPLQPGARTLSFQGGGTGIYWKRIVLPCPPLGSAGGGSPRPTGKGKERAYPGSNTTSGRSEHLDHSRTDLGRILNDCVKSTYLPGIQPGTVGVFRPSEDTQSDGTYWVFSMTEDRMQETNRLIPPECSSECTTSNPALGEMLINGLFTI